MFTAGSGPSFPPDFSSSRDSLIPVGERSTSVDFHWREARKLPSTSRDERGGVCSLQNVQDSCWDVFEKKRISGGGWSSSVLARLLEKFIFYVAFRLRVSNSALCKKAFIIRPEMFVCVQCSFNMRHNGNSSQTEMKRVTLGLQRFPSRPDSPPGVRVIALPSYTCLYVAGSVSLTAVTSGCIPNTTGRVGGCAASRCDG